MVPLMRYHPIDGGDELQAHWKTVLAEIVYLF
jgi:hypothetical protein